MRKLCDKKNINRFYTRQKYPSRQAASYGPTGLLLFVFPLYSFVFFKLELSYRYGAQQGELGSKGEWSKRKQLGSKVGSKQAQLTVMNNGGG